MAVFIDLWSYLLTTKLRCLQKNNIGHTKLQDEGLVQESIAATANTIPYILTSRPKSMGMSNKMVLIYNDIKV